MVSRRDSPGPRRPASAGRPLEYEQGGRPQYSADRIGRDAIRNGRGRSPHRPTDPFLDARRDPEGGRLSYGLPPPLLLPPPALPFELPFELPFDEPFDEPLAFPFEAPLALPLALPPQLPDPPALTTRQVCCWNHDEMFVPNIAVAARRIEATRATSNPYSTTAIPSCANVRRLIRRSR